MRRYIIATVIIFTLLLQTSCSLISNRQSKEKPLARVYGSYLYLSDIQQAIPHNMSVSDSSEMLQSYINSWIKRQLLLKKAEENNVSDQHEIDALVEDYRQSLLIYDYESQVVAKNLDTVVTEKEIEAYYAQNQSNFELQESVIQLSYVITKQGNLRPAVIQSLLASSDFDTLQMLETFCKEKALKHDIDGAKWRNYKNIINELSPLKYYNENTLYSRQFVYYKDVDVFYYIYIKDFKMTETVAPLELVVGDIKSILINKRKKQLLKSMENELYKTANNNSAIEIY